MRIRVDCYSGYRGEEIPRHVYFDGRCVEVNEVLDSWLAPDHRYFKVLAADKAVYIIRHDISEDAWELTMYQSGTTSGTGQDL